MAEGTQYLIDIAAQVDGGADAAAQLTALAGKLNASGTAAQMLDAALARTSAQLAQASAASMSANEALSAQSAKYAQLEKGAVKAATALERATLKGAKPEKLAELGAAAQAAAASLKAEGAALDELRAKAATADAAHAKLAASMKNLEAASKGEAARLGQIRGTLQGTGKLNGLEGALSKLGGPLGSAGGKALGLYDSIGKLAGSAGMAAGALGGVVVVALALAAAAAAVTIAIGAAIVKTAIWAVKLADTGRNAALTVEAIEQTSARLSGLSRVLPGVANATGLTQDAMIGLAKQLDGAKVSAAEMPAALMAVAKAEAALGAGGAAEFIADLKAGKKTVAELSREIETKFGRNVAKRMLSLDSQTDRLKKNLGETFGGLKIDGLLQGLTKIVDLFDQSTAFGKTLKWVFESAFQPLINAATSSLPKVEALLLGVAIGALKVYLGIKPAIKEIQKLNGIDTSKLPDALTVALTIGKALGGAIAFVALSIGVVVGALALFAAGHVAVYNAGKKAWDGITEGINKAKAFLASVSLSEIGTRIIQGLANGITGGASKVLSAMTGVVKGAIGAAEKLLKIGSPSRLFEQLGAWTTEGYAGGVESNEGMATSALESMVTPPDAQQMQPAAGRGGGANLSGATFNFYGVRDAEDAEGRFAGLLTRVLEGDVASLGGEPATT